MGLGPAVAGGTLLRSRRRPRRTLVLLLLAAAFLEASCALIMHSLATGGEEQLKPMAASPIPPAPRVIIFALDGTGPDQLMEAVHSGKAPHIAALLGRDRGGGLFEHAYAAPDVLSVLPSSTIADWAAIFTGRPPARNGVPGDEWFVRDTAKFYAPVPVSVQDTGDVSKAVDDDLVGQALEVPTLYESIHERSNVSLLSVHRGAALYTTVAPSSLADLLGDLIAGTLEGASPDKSLSAGFDLDSVHQLTQSIDEHGVPDLQVVYFPGIDIFTHRSKDRLEGQVQYLEEVTDQAVGLVLSAYEKRSLLQNTYVLFIADHAQIPTVADERHELGTAADDSPFAVVGKAGFRVRKPTLSLGPGDRGYQAVLAYQGFMAYVYLADRTTCPKEGDLCDWIKPPRFRADVLPVARAFYEANRTGKWAPKLRGTIDLIFARKPVAAGRDAHPFEVFDGKRLVPIRRYLEIHPRPDLVRLDERMKWLGVGPYGNRAGDVVLLARACENLPIEDRYFFAGLTHYTWHGSACETDGRVPFVLAQRGGSGAKIRALVRKVAGTAPSEMMLTPLVRSLFRDGSASSGLRAPSGRENARGRSSSDAPGAAGRAPRG
jgi:hypothetical protein